MANNNLAFVLERKGGASTDEYKVWSSFEPSMNLYRLSS